MSLLLPFCLILLSPCALALALESTPVGRMQHQHCVCYWQKWRYMNRMQFFFGCIISVESTELNKMFMMCDRGRWVEKYVCTGYAHQMYHACWKKKIMPYHKLKGKPFNNTIHIGKYLWWFNLLHFASSIWVSTLISCYCVSRNPVYRVVVE